MMIISYEVRLKTTKIPEDTQKDRKRRLFSCCYASSLDATGLQTLILLLIRQWAEMAQILDSNARNLINRTISPLKRLQQEDAGLEIRWW